MNDEAKRLRERIDAILRDAAIPKDRTNVRASWGVRDYRGKRQRVVGYSWTKPYAHHFSGRVHEVVLGWGPTFDDACHMAEQRQEQFGRCCYGGRKRKSDCASCAAWTPEQESDNAG